PRLQRLLCHRAARAPRLQGGQIRLDSPRLTATFGQRFLVLFRHCHLLDLRCDIDREPGRLSIPKLDGIETNTNETIRPRKGSKREKPLRLAGASRGWALLDLNQ